MIEFFMSFIGLVLFMVAVAAGIIFPLWAISIAYKLARSAQRIASSLERMEGLQMNARATPPPPTADEPLEIRAGRPVVNSMFGR